MGLSSEEYVFYKYHKPDIAEVTIKEIFEWLRTLDDEDRIKVHAFSRLWYRIGKEEEKECQK